MTAKRTFSGGSLRNSPVQSSPHRVVSRGDHFTRIGQLRRVRVEIVDVQEVANI